MAASLGVRQLRFTKTAQEIQSTLECVVSAYEAKINNIVIKNMPLIKDNVKLEFGATFAALANADGQASLVSAELTIPALVNGDGSIRAASSNAKKQLQHMWARTYSRPDL